MPISVVVIDDHEMLLEGLVRALAGEPDIEVVATATSLTAGLQAVRRHDPDVIVVDQTLRTPDGGSASRCIVDVSPRARLVMLTPPNGNADVPRPRVHLYLDKIHAIERLAQAIRAASDPPS